MNDYPSTPDEALDLIGAIAHVPIRQQRKPDQVRAFEYALQHSTDRGAVLLAGEILGLTSESSNG